eukprot:Rhum_TRINITY_DN14257_c9_g1::Rhum_TRINITY_DN14257_c9_g1_i1::g.76073::m.76073
MRCMGLADAEVEAVKPALANLCYAQAGATATSAAATPKHPGTPPAARRGKQRRALAKLFQDRLLRSAAYLRSTLAVHASARSPGQADDAPLEAFLSTLLALLLPRCLRRRIAHIGGLPQDAVVSALRDAAAAASSASAAGVGGASPEEAEVAADFASTWMHVVETTTLLSYPDTHHVDAAEVLRYLVPDAASSVSAPKKVGYTNGVSYFSLPSVVAGGTLAPLHPASVFRSLHDTECAALSRLAVKACEPEHTLGDRLLSFADPAAAAFVLTIEGVRNLPKKPGAQVSIRVGLAEQGGALRPRSSVHTMHAPFTGKARAAEERAAAQWPDKLRLPVLVTLPPGEAAASRHLGVAVELVCHVGALHLRRAHAFVPFTELLDATPPHKARAHALATPADGEAGGASGSGALAAAGASAAASGQPALVVSCGPRRRIPAMHALGATAALAARKAGGLDDAPAAAAAAQPAASAAAEFVAAALPAGLVMSGDPRAMEVAHAFRSLVTTLLRMHGYASRAETLRRHGLEAFAALASRPVLFRSLCRDYAAHVERAEKDAHKAGNNVKKAAKDGPDVGLRHAVLSHLVQPEKAGAVAACVAARGRRGGDCGGAVAASSAAHPVGHVGALRVREAANAASGAALVDTAAAKFADTLCCGEEEMARRLLAPGATMLLNMP